MNRKFDWIFFDLDGTLADSISVMYQVYLDFLSDFSKKGTREEFDELNGPALLEIVAVLKSRYKLTEDKDSLVNFYKNKISASYKSHVKPIDGSGAVLQELKNRGYKMMLVTSSDQDIALEFIRSQKWEQYFQNYVFGNQINKAKPASEIYELALKRADASSGSVAVIEDSCNGIKSAKAAGAFVIGLASHQTKEELLKAGANSTISHLTEIMPIIEVKI